MPIALAHDNMVTYSLLILHPAKDFSSYKTNVLLGNARTNALYTCEEQRYKSYTFYKNLKLKWFYAGCISRAFFLSSNAISDDF